MPTGSPQRADIGAALLGILTLIMIAVSLSGAGCARVKPWQRGELASPAMQFQMSPLSHAQLDSVLEITEGSTFSSAGPGSAGAGCGCH